MAGMPVPSRFGKFVLLQRIGGGLLSQVFRVSWQGREAEPARVALKRVHPSRIGQPDFVQLVVREARLLTRLSHPNLCTCQELGVIDGCPFLTLDLVDGCTLRALMRRLSQQEVSLPHSAVTALGYQLAGVLDYLHRGCESPLVHLDLSPQNVMISSSGEVKLIDFGIARYLDGHEPPPVGGRIAGTIGYMSPEQARGDSVDDRADQFGLGVLLWEMLSAQRLYRGNTHETWERMRAGDTPPAETSLAEVPPDLRGAVSRLLQSSAEDRFANMAEVQLALTVGSSSPVSGMKPLSALVQHLMADPGFDPFDVVRVAVEPDVPPDIPHGDEPGADYAELSIEVDQGAGSPGYLVRSVVSERPGTQSSPFLELGEMEAGSGDEESAPRSKAVTS